MNARKAIALGIAVTSAAAVTAVALASGSDASTRQGRSTGSISRLAPAGSVSAAVAAAASPVPSTRLPRCRTADLRLSVLAETAKRHHGGGMNHQGATIMLTNRSKVTCTVYGYPGAAMLAARSGRVIQPGRVVRGSTWYANDPRPHLVVLRPGRSAYGELSWTSADGRLRAAQAGAIIVTPPDQRTALRAPLHTFLGGDRTITATALTGTLPRLRG